MARLIPKLTIAAEKSTLLVKTEAQALAPVASGDLRDSITGSIVWRGSSVIGTVQATAHHAAFVEFGTGLRGRGTYPFALPSQGVPITGSWIYDYKQQGWKGMTSQPYMRPALDNNGAQILQIYRDALK